MIIHIETIEHSTHRYPSCGDWFFTPDGTLEIRVSNLEDNRYEFLIALHELIEAWLCKASGIAQSDVDAWDMEWEAKRGKAHSAVTGEPGDDHRSPYHKEHKFATMIEMMVAHELKVRWKAYSAAIEALE